MSLYIPTSLNHEKTGRGNKEQGAKEPWELEYKTVLFTEFTKDGELASTLRELCTRLAPLLGFKIKVVERAGTALKNMFPTNNLWEGQKCGRPDCTTCEQGAEIMSPCTQASVVYENICETCNPGAGGKKELKEIRSDIPTMYVGETSRSLYERSKEQWSTWRSRKHSRQVGEAVRIRRRGGAGSILNSKTEYDRCRIPRLVVQEEDEEEIAKKED